MIERFYLQNHLTFSEVELELHPGLIIFSGPSGSGKSVLMRSILGSFGLENSDATLSESSVTFNINEDDIGIENEATNIFKQVKKEKVRFFINNQAISKKVLLNETRSNLKYLNIKDFSDFESSQLLQTLDTFIMKSDATYSDVLQKFTEVFNAYKKVSAQLLAMEDEEKRIVELKEFTRFEIEKIESISPKVGEDEALLEIKKSLSQKEKIEAKLNDAQKLFDYEYLVNDALSSIDIDSAFFDDAMNELRTHFDKASEKLYELEETDIEEVLTRIEDLSSLKQRYVSIENALEVLEKKKEELAYYESINVTKNSYLEKKEALYREVDLLAQKISVKRHDIISMLEDKINTYVKELYLDPIHIEVSQSELHVLGYDTVEVTLNNTALSNMSSGEFNRLRLALLALKTEVMQHHGGILMLDEIDANLSGEESMSVASVLKVLAKKFQIFAISHQPQLSSMADHHYLVYKDSNESFVKHLSEKDRIQEIARMISAGDITEEALKYASKLLENK